MFNEDVKCHRKCETQHSSNASDLFCIDNYATQQAGDHRDAALLPDYPPRHKSFTVGGMGQDDFSTCATIQAER